MTDNEKKILEHLKEAHNLFIAEVKNDEVKREWCTCLHVLQMQVMVRETIRNNPSIFYQGAL